LDRASDYGSEG